jgi:hypothetical protein
MAKPVTGETKKPYATPVLAVHGTVRELTLANQAGGRNDAASIHAFKHRTAV